ncbi:class I SAM-dependent methyltransferase [Candidatus Fermentibacterales bacterium]|nr:class I SAM-dependent methyltransferase [Candidatus Fermentibacterales bacterium]
MLLHDYGLPRGYAVNDVSAVEHLSRDPLKYQAGVYRKAAEILKDQGLDSVLDVGCGMPEKLLRYVAPVSSAITGVDLPESVSAFREAERFAFGDWIAMDLERSPGLLGSRFDLVIAADVIEHLRDPDRLLAWICAHSDERTWILLSTPDRSTLGVSRRGPPRNPHHVREWSRREFRRYLRGRGFGLVESLALREPDGYSCHLCVCRRPHEPCGELARALGEISAEAEADSGATRTTLGRDNA